MVTWNNLFPSLQRLFFINNKLSEKKQSTDFEKDAAMDRGYSLPEHSEFLLLQLEINANAPLSKNVQLLSNHSRILKSTFQIICAELNIDEKKLSIILRHIPNCNLTR